MGNLGSRWRTLGAFIALLVTGSVWAQAQVLFRPLSAQDLQDVNPAQSRQVEKIRARPSTGSVTLMRLDAAALDAPTVTMALGDKQASFNRSRSEALGPNTKSWIGTIPGVPGQATLILHNGNITGSVHSNGDLYRIEPIGNGVHAVIKVDTARLPPDHPPSFQEKERRAVPAARPSSRSDAQDGPVGIDVLVAYTGSAGSAVSDISAAIQLAIIEANQSYVNSGVNIKLNLVDTMPVSYSENGKSFDKILADFVGMQAVKDRRNSSGGDLVAMIINQAEYCGLADAINATEATAYAIVHYDCATGYYSFAHELGHLMGARHDPATDPTPTPFPYGHGYRYESGTTKWRTIMAYNCPSGCLRLQYWSNPNIKFNGVAMGTAATSDNARVLNETASTMAGFRTKMSNSPHH